MDFVGLIGLFAGIAVAAAILLSLLFIFQKSQNTYATNLLGAIFLSIAFRVGKSIWYFVFNSVIPFGSFLGLLGLASIGPLLYLYLKSITKKEKQISKNDWWHLTIPIVFGLLFWIKPIGEVLPKYKMATVTLFMYLIIAAIKHFQHNYQKVEVKRWNLSVLIAVTGVGCSFVFQHFTDTILQYALGSGLAGIFIYFLLVQFLLNKIAFPTKKVKGSPKKVLNKVKQAFEKDQIYRQKNLTINEFAAQASIPSYLVSKAVNEVYQKSFPETVNYFRIEEVKQKLLSKENDFIKIEGLAYEVGFNTPSAFYAAFKKVVGMSPKSYQKLMQKQMEEGVG